ncbi:XRE family transcriptional regulator [Pseudoflavonifractor sp. 60]|nr:XRE family transcriptional regulator [Pseudoflavonifractor sp. 60]
MKVVRLCLDQYLDANEISRYNLAKNTGIQYHIIDGYYKNKVFRLDGYNLGRIIEALDCQLTDILTVVDE